MGTRTGVVVFFCLAFVLCGSYASADEIVDEIIWDDPATLHVGPGSCAGTQSLTGCGGHPNLIGNSGLVTIYQNSGGVPLSTSPVLLILAIGDAFNPNLFNSASISSVSIQNPLGGASVAGTATYGGAYGLSSAGFQGSMGAGTDVYTFLCAAGLQPPGCAGVNNSNNFGNLSGALLANGEPSPGSFGIYVFSLNGAIDSKGLISAQFASPLPSGTFVLGYSQTAEKKGKNTRITIYTTPFTESGLTGRRITVPEPGALSLLFAGLLSMTGIFRRKSN